MGARERAKGRAGEAEVAELFRGHGFEVRGLEGGGDHLMFRAATTGPRPALTIHSEAKRCETARPWAWLAQAEAEAPPGTVPVVTFRRNRSQWYALLSADDLARLLGEGGEQERAHAVSLRVVHQAEQGNVYDAVCACGWRQVGYRTDAAARRAIRRHVSFPND